MNQQQVWDNIAEEWSNFKKIPANATLDFLNDQTGKILDLGSGSGRNMINIKSGKMYLLDFSRQMIELAKQKAKHEKIDAEFYISELDDLPFENDFFDGAICISALHCIETPEKRKKTIQELYRVMKKGSQAKIGVWNFISKRFNQKNGKNKIVGWRDKGKRYYYLYDENEVHDLFREIGFKILKTDNTEMMINFIIEKHSNQ